MDDDRALADIHDRLGAFKDADGALIGIDARGKVAMDSNKLGMFRGYAMDNEAPAGVEYDGQMASRAVYSLLSGPSEVEPFLRLRDRFVRLSSPVEASGDKPSLVNTSCGGSTRPS
jgi:hypothetical protein